MSEILENKTFDEIGTGDSASLTRALRYEDLETWAAVTGNVNLVDAVECAAREGIAQEGGSYAMWGTALFSTIVGTLLPGAGTQLRSVQVEYHRPIVIGSEVTATVTVTGRNPEDGSLTLDCRCLDPDGSDYITATAEVVAPTKKIREPIRRLPEVHLQREDRFSTLLDEAAALQAMPTAVVHPCSTDALVGPIQAAERDLIKPILVGPAAKIRSIAEAEGLDISPYPLIDVEHSHRAAERAVAMVRAGEAEILMKGSLHTDELLHEVLRRDTGIRTERRLSHCFLLAVPTYARPFILTDAAINIAPDLMAKRDICQNAIDMARAMGIEEPKLAILAAVESVNPTMPATLDAAALCKMADRGQIKGAILDGPLAFDNAADEEAARTKGIVSPVAGKADILLVPDLETGNMLAKQLIFMARAEAAGIVAGAQVPIVLTSRADSVRTRLASCAVAALLAKAKREGVVGRKVAGH
jgi:phosphotransacetylase/acyl dehydratase